MKQLRRIEKLRLLLLVAALLVVGLEKRLQAAEPSPSLHVANNGTDSPACGGEDHPCRSISQAIANASAGDTIVVGPGRYGDLNGNGIFGEPGEEAAEVGFGCACMIHVNKPVKLESRDGAFVTVLDAAGGAQITVVYISVGGVEFGAAHKGFTITGSANGFPGLTVAADAGVQIRGNLAIGNGSDGFLVSGGSGHRLSGNVAVGNSQNGFAVVLGSGHKLTDNLANSNRLEGYFLSGSNYVLEGNSATENDLHGFAFDGSGHVLNRNAALGNKNAGVAVLGGTVTVSKNNIYGNNSVPTNAIFNNNNYGLINGSGGLITATNNFWGASSGPGLDPADVVCDFGSSSTVFSPFATEEFKIRQTPLK
jgi:hypothetical protein